MTTGNLYRYEYQFLKRLEDLSYPYYLKNKLEYYWVTVAKKNPEHIEKVKQNLIERISTYYEHDTLRNSKLVWRGKKPRTAEELAKPISLDTDYGKIAVKSASYFKQANELYKTSLTMNDNSSPLVEYYSFLQCVKGCVLLLLDINEEILFRQHGTSHQFNESSDKYPRANIKTTGVFHTILLLQDPYNEMNKYFTKGEMDLSLDNLLEFRSHTPASAFIISFILSSLVRYYPEYWQRKLQGIEDDIIREIIHFRCEVLPKQIDSLFPYLLRLG